VSSGLAALSLLVVGAAARLGQSASPALPPPTLRIAGNLAALTAPGPTTAITTYDYTVGCSVRLVKLAAGGRPAAVAGRLPCLESENGADSFISDLWLGRAAVGTIVIDSPSPHGDTYT
jgi:hypothetical protein